MLVSHDGKQYYVDFRHDRPGEDRTEVLVDSLGRRHVVFLDDPDQRRLNRQRTTTCTILFVPAAEPNEVGADCPSVMASGASTCGDKDRFDKETGRRISLARATSRLPSSQDGLKAAIWRTYSERKRKS